MIFIYETNAEITTGKLGLSFCNKWIKTHVFNSTEKHHINMTFPMIMFQNQSELTDIKNIKCPMLAYIEQLKFFSVDQIVLNNDLDLRHVSKLFSFPANRLKAIVIENSRGFNQNKNDNIYENSYFSYLNDIRLEFYLEEKILRDDDCLRSNFEYGNIFGSLKSLMFAYNIRYSQKICPYLFMNSTVLTELVFSHISNSFLFKNQLIFLYVDNKTEFHTKELYYLKLQVYSDAITRQNINPHIFKNMIVLTIMGNIELIERDLFIYFKKIRYLSLNIQNLRQLLHSSGGVKWLLPLYNDRKVILLEFKQTSSFFNTIYPFPDADLCLFKDFPHENAIYPILNLGETFECSCTILWLLKNDEFFFGKNTQQQMLNFISFYPQLNYNFTTRDCLLKSIECPFELRLNNCVEIEITKEWNIFVGDLGAIHAFKTLQYIIQVYFGPIFSVLGVVTNFVTLLIVSNKKSKKVFKNSMYDHIKINSMFNFSYCLINSFSLINLCIDNQMAFCSSIYKTKFAQYFRIIFTNYLGNILKFSCSVSYIAFSASRFLHSTNTSKTDSRPISHWLNNLNLKKFYSSLFAFSALFSIFKIFQFRENEFYGSYEQGFPFDVYDIRYCSNDLYFSQTFSFNCKFISILNLINNILNHIVFFIVSIIIDIFLLRFTHAEVKRKKQSNFDERIINDTIKMKTKVNRMVLSNGILYFLSHAPEFSIDIFLMVGKKRLDSFCKFEFNCESIREITEAFIMLSMSMQMFVFLKFDKNFKSMFGKVILQKIFPKKISAETK